MKQSVILIIHGRVQGVGFRYFVKQKADVLGITGFVKNQLGGAVYVEAEGEEVQLQLFIHFCRQGSKRLIFNIARHRILYVLKGDNRRFSYIFFSVWYKVFKMNCI